MATIESVYSAVTASPGTSLGIPLPTLQKIWQGTCQWAESNALQRRSVRISNFAQVTVQQQVGYCGLWGKRTSWIPSVVLSPGFCASFNIHASLPFSHAHVGCGAPVDMNPSLVASALGVPRHVVANGLKDLVRGIGLLAQKGDPLTIDMHFCSLDFQRGRYSVRWSKQFVDQFVGWTSEIETQSARSPSPRTVHTLQFKPVPPGARPCTARQSGNIQEVTHTEKTQTDGRPFSARAPKNEPQSDGATKVEPSNSHEVPEKSSQQEPVEVQNAAKFLPPTPPLPQEGSVPPPVRSRQDPASLLRAIPEDWSPYARRKARKTIYRKIRNKAYEDSWETQLALKRQACAQERQRERDHMERVIELVHNNALAAAKDRHARLQHAQQTLAYNHTLAQMRQDIGIPKSQPAGDLFDARPITCAAPHDVPTLLQQIELRRQRVLADRAADRATAEQADKAKEEWQRDIVADLEKKRDAQNKMSAIYEGQIAQRQSEERNYRRSLTNGGALLFSGNDSQRQEKEEQRLVKERTRQFQQENLRALRQKHQEEAEQETRRRKKQKQEEEEFWKRDQQLQAQQARAKQAIAASLRHSWDTQMSERRNAQSAERQHLASWHEMNYLKNESSDDEADPKVATTHIPQPPTCAT